MTDARDPMSVFTPSFPTLVKLGSAIVHADEYVATGYGVDLDVFCQLLSDPDVQAWLTLMRSGAFLPVKRSEDPS